MGEISKALLYFYMGGMLVFGTANTIIMKLADMTKSDGEYFTHPYFQCALMFSGELLCLGFYAIIKWQEKRKAV